MSFTARGPTNTLVVADPATDPAVEILDWDDPTPPAPIPAPTKPKAHVNGSAQPKAKPPARTHEEPPESYEAARPVRIVPAQPERQYRDLPSDTEAEELTLSCCMGDDGDTLLRARDSISASDFYDSKHDIIFRGLCEVQDAGQSPSIDLVALWLRENNLVDKIGGYAFLTQITSRSPTTAQAGTFIEAVRRQSILRRLIRASSQISESAYTFDGDLPGLLSESESRLQEITAPATAKPRLFSVESLIPKPSPIFTLAKIPICTPGNLTTIISQAKAGKSATVGAMIAATLIPSGALNDCLGFTAANPDGHALLHFDTEQSPYHWQESILSTLRRAQIETPPSWLLSHHLTGASADDCKRTLSASLRGAARRFGRIHSVFIDGVADLVNDPNDSEECFPLITWLHGLAIKHDTTIICVLHLNPSSETKGRGHLGSQLERKSESNLTLTKTEDGVTTITSGRQRGASIPLAKAPAFRWDAKSEMHVSCEGPKPKPTGRPTMYEFSTYKPLFPTKDSIGLPLPELNRRLDQNGPIPSKQFAAVIKRWEAEGAITAVITQGQATRWRLTV